MKIAVLGSGSWGTALADVLLDNGHEVIIWGINIDEIVDIDLYKQNSRYFQSTMLNPKATATNDFTKIIDVEMVIIATPSFAVEEICNLINTHFNQKIIIVNVAKGFHEQTKQTPYFFIKDNINVDILGGIASLIGPSHAEEVIKKLVTSIVVASEDEKTSLIVQEAFANDYFRVYTSDDPKGAELGAALKNVIALASGILTGLNLGDNARAALITRGLKEICRFGVKLGGKEETFYGLTGLGDLIVTATSTHSRNFSAGQEIGLHNSAQQFWKNNEKTVEGVNACKYVYELAKKHKIVMPITSETYKILFKEKEPKQAVTDLMIRPLKSE